MRKKVLLFVIAQFVIFAGFAQNTFKPETSIGIKLGGNISSVNFDPVIPQNINNGYLGGITFKHIEEKNLGIQIELNYLQFGWSENLADTIGTYSRRLNYIQFPLMTHLNFGKNKTRFFLNIGPHMSYLISENETINIFNEANEAPYYRTKIANRLEIGLGLGIGITQHTSIGVFQLEGRGNIGLTNIFEETIETPFDISRNMAAELTLSFSLAKK